MARQCMAGRLDTAATPDSTPDSRLTECTVLVDNPEVLELVHACLHGRPFAWQRFVDRFLPVVLQTVQEIDVQASRGWSAQQQEEMTREVFDRVRQDNYRLLREWDEQSDFETWLIIAIRRITCAARGDNQTG